MMSAGTASNTVPARAALNVDVRVPTAAAQTAVDQPIAPLTQAAVGGASDGNCTAGVGCPTLDGLGAVGDGANADHEHVVTATMPVRARLLAHLVGALR
ncbi:hypothetical protein GCM10014713_59730 [Streptomyces purpureus]|uniref:Uncharacterized protein n=1 Tax=Streptomyces purpureus TaxID=1951 RepID=A0A918HEZ3_9ACTN|nr:hypothetical protein GCM10014713_59730 [Streptomyces purpureus]